MAVFSQEYRGHLACFGPTQHFCRYATHGEFALSAAWRGLGADLAVGLDLLRDGAVGARHGVKLCEADELDVELEVSKALGWSKRCKLVDAFYSYKGLKLAQLLSRHGEVFLT
jgi:hypothetical protein